MWAAEMWRACARRRCVIGSLVFGYAVYRTGSLISVIVAHGILNVPLSLGWRYIVLTMSLSALFLFRRETGEWLKGLGRLMYNIDDWIAMLLAVGLIAGSLLTLRAAPWAPYAWLGVFAILLVLGLGVRSAWEHRDEGKPYAGSALSLPLLCSVKQSRAFHRR